MLNERIQNLLNGVLRGDHKSKRAPLSPERYGEIARTIQNPALSLNRRTSLRLKLFLESETVGGLDDASFVGLRTIPDFPAIYAIGEFEALTDGHFVHEQGRVCNIAYDYAGVIAEGLLPRRARIIDSADDPDYAAAAVECIDAVIAFADRHAALLEIRGQSMRAQALRQSIRTGATDFWAALQSFRILHFALWASNVYHNTVGRFDQYMLPYFKRDMASGSLTSKSALELLEEFFLTFNIDSDLYQGMQQGDNGQSMVLGGCDADGNDAYNELSALCLKASLEIRLIDPKINLRVNKNTPLKVFEECTQLTRQGLGFPQYANDDTVIPALEKLGYSQEDARNYVVAACWEFIIPGVAMDIPNIGAISLAATADATIRAQLASCDTFDELLSKFKYELRNRAETLAESLKPLFIEPAPYASVLMTDCAREISRGARYNNYGIHGTGYTLAVDQLATVKQLIFDTHEISKQRLLDALNTDFAHDNALLNKLRRTSPKLGRDDCAEDLADPVLDAFADALAGLKNERGGIFRAGTGSAMFYIWHAKELGYTCDGHVPGEPFPANFSPSLLLHDAGPLSVMQAFARPEVARCINGGPLTFELHDTVFKRPDGITKVAQLVRSFVTLGGHQLQLNAVNRDQLLDAQQHPENHAGLIVRVWGWSGHFVLLDRSYQDQIIARTSYSI